MLDIYDGHFGHSGDLGDIIYALPSIRSCGGGVLHLFDTPGKTTYSMTAERVNQLAPLLIEQDYITDVRFETDRKFESLINGFRDHCDNVRNLADAHLATVGKSFSERNRAWLKVVPKTTLPVIINRTSRYHNFQFDWSAIVEKYSGKIGFIGYPDEYHSFQESFGDVEYIQTDNMLELAKIIAGSQLFIGGQSSAAAIAEGLKIRMILEVCPNIPNCLFPRMNRIDGWDKIIDLPDIA